MGRIDSFLDKIPYRLCLIFPLALYLGVTLFWQYKGFNKLVGDEVHYLLVTESIITDGDLRVLNNYAADSPLHRATGIPLTDPSHLRSHVFKGFSRHNPGLPIILAIPYFIGGIAGAKLFMTLLAGVWPFLAYKTFFRITGSKSWSALVAFTVAVGLPFVAAANQIFPDLLVGTIIFYAVEKLFQLMDAKEEVAFSRFGAAWLGLLIGFLPWLHIRFIAPALILLFGYFYVVKGQRRQPGGRAKRWQLFAPAAIFAGSLILLASYNQAAFANPLGPYDDKNFSFQVIEITMIFLGLHWDQTQGMFMQQPFFLLSLVGIVPFIRANWRGAVLAGTLYLSILIPNSMHSAWYGGFSFAGRFWWAAIGLLFFPLAHAIRFLLDRSKQLLLALCGSTLLLQGWLACKWLLLDLFLVRRDLPIWATRSFYDDSGTLLLLPTFGDFDVYLRHPANYLCVLLTAVLIFSGWVWRHRSNKVPVKVWLAVLIMGAGVLLWAPPAVGSWKLDGNLLLGRIGTLGAKSRIASEENGAGTLVFGPYAMLLAGDYEVTIEYQFEHELGTAAAHYDIVYGPDLRAVADIELPPSSTNNGVFKHRFSVRQSQSLGPLFQFRIHYPGRGKLRFDRLTITPIYLSQ